MTTTTIMWQNKDEADYSIQYFNLTSENGINTMKGTVILLLDQFQYWYTTKLLVISIGKLDQ